MDEATHKRFLDYRERHVYFGTKVRLLGGDEFAALDAEQRALEALGEDRRSSEEQARYVEVTILLFRD